MTQFPDITDAKTAAQLERAWIRHLHALPSYSQPRKRAAAEAPLKQAIEDKGWELVAASSMGWKIPRFTRRGSSYVVTLCGQTYKTGRWGNGAGYRYALCYAEEWVKTTGKYRSRRRVQSVVSWVLFGMPHRALQVLA